MSFVKLRLFKGPFFFLRNGVTWEDGSSKDQNFKDKCLNLSVAYKPE